MNDLKDENVDWKRWLQKRVCVKGTLFGTLKYFGTTQFCDGLWCGIELDEPVGKNDGTVNSVTYFTCLPKFGIFVPLSKVCKIENDSRNLNGTFTHLNGTFKVQNCRENTILVSNSDNQLDNCNEEISQVEINKPLSKKIKHDSEESLGLLDPNLMESLTTSWDSLILDGVAVGDIAPDSHDSIFKLNNQESDFAGPFSPTSNSFFSDEISNPKYASTPRHPVKGRLVEFKDVDEIGLQNVNGYNDVFENQVNCVHDVFFDTEKFKHNPNLASTSKIFNTSSDNNMNILSPDKCIDLNKTQSQPIDLNATQLQSIDLNKTQIIPLPLITNQGIIPVTMDLNKTQTFYNGCKSVSNVDILSTTFKMPFDAEPQINSENKDETLFQKTFVLDSSISEEKQSSKQAASVDVLSNVEFESFDYKNKFLEETTILEKSLSEVNLRNSECIPVKSRNISNCSQRFSYNFDLNSTFQKGNVTSNVSMSSKNQKSVSSIQLKTNNADKKVDEFKKPRSMYSSIRRPYASLKNVSSAGPREKGENSYSKGSLLVHSDNVNLKKTTASVDMKLSQQEKENRISYSIENESVLPDNSRVSNINSKTGLSSVDIKSKRGRLSASFDLDNKLNKLAKAAVKSKYSRRISYSQSTESTGLLNVTGNLSLQSKDNECSKNSYKINFSASSKASSTSDSNVPGTSKVHLNSVKNAATIKKTINKTSNGLDKNQTVTQLKVPVTKNKLPVSRQSLGLSSNGCGIPRRNSLAASSKTSVPVGIIKPRYSMLPSIEERNLLKVKNTGPIAEQLAKSSDHFVPKAVPTVSSCPTANSSKASRTASSLPQKSQIATRKMGQKYSDVKEESGACPKIARYNLRGKK